MKTAMWKLATIAALIFIILIASGWTIVAMCEGDCGGHQRPGAPWGDLP